MRGLRAIINHFHHIKSNNVLVVGLFATGLLAISGFGIFSQNALASENPDNDIVRGGIYGRDLGSKCGGDVKTIMDHYWIDCNLAGVQDGRACRDGNVYLGDRVVARSSSSIGRLPINGSHPISIGGQTYYETPNDAAFLQECIDAFVLVDQNGTFKYAILKPCGNPIYSPAPVVNSPAPTPAPVINYNTYTPPTQTPTYNCNSLVYQPTDTTVTTKNFTATAASSGGATIVGYKFDFGDGSGIQDSSSSTAIHTYSAGSGTFTARVTAKFSVNGQIVQASSANCAVQITLAQPTPNKISVCDMNTGNTVQVDSSYDQSRYTTDFTKCQKCQYNTDILASNPACTAPATALPKTGANDLIGAGIGCGSLIIAGSAYLSSRRDLLSAFLKR